MREWCFDSDAWVAGSATLRLTGQGSDGVMERLVRSPHAWVRRLAREEGERRDPWRGARSELSRLAARRILREDRPAMVNQVRARLASSNADEQVAAIMMARHLGLQADLELELLAAASGSSGERVCATATAALSEVDTPAAGQAVRALVRHPVDRVRANAVDGLLRSPGVGDVAAYGAALELRGDPCHRVRASALRGLLVCARGYEPEAAESLASMLGDDRPLHRLAGLWAVERVLLGPAGGGLVASKWNELAGRVADLAKSEPESPVRARAVRCASRMLARMRSGWERRAVAVGEDAA
jgi:hypothetical protein